MAKYIFACTSPYDSAAVCARLERMALRGWMIDKPGEIFWRFRAIEPKKLRFHVLYLPEANDLEPAPSEELQFLQELGEGSGWNFAASRGQMQIFYNEDPEAVAMETDPVAQAENVYRAIRKGAVLRCVLMLAIVLWQLFSQQDSFLRDPMDFLSDPSEVYRVFLWIVLIIWVIYDLVRRFWWRRRAFRIAREEGRLLPFRAGVLGWLFTFSCIALLLAAFGGSVSGRWAILLWFILFGIVMALVKPLQHLLKKKGVHHMDNALWSGLAVGVLTLALFFALAAVIPALQDRGVISLREQHAEESYIYDGESITYRCDAPPLAAEEIFPEVQARWSSTVVRQSTILAEQVSCSQQPLLTAPEGTSGITCVATVFRVPGLMTLAVDNTMEHMTGLFLGYEYVAVAPNLWGAEQAWELHLNGAPMNSWLVCMEDTVLEVWADTSLTPEQMRLIAESY